MNISQDHHQSHRLRPPSLPTRHRLHQLLIGLLHLHLATLSMLLFASATSAFAPSISKPRSNLSAIATISNISPVSYYYGGGGGAQRRNSVASLLMAKKRRKRSSSDEDNGEVIANPPNGSRSSSEETNGINNNDTGSDSSSGVETTASYANEDRSKQSKNNNNSIDEEEPKQTTLSGGPSLIFEMARRMLVWDDELYDSSQILNDAGSRSGGGSSTASTSIPSSSADYLNTLPTSTSPSTAATSGTSMLPSPSSIMPPAGVSNTPRWRPTGIRQQSISNINPSFRTASPIMTNAGYASILRRNSRKKNKPSMWRHCLRIYGKMGELEREQSSQQQERVGEERSLSSGGVVAAPQPQAESSSAQSSNIPGVGNNLATPSSANSTTGTTTKKKRRIRRSTAHHEAALVAAAKLGMWEEALLIFRGVEDQVARQRQKNQQTTNTSSEDILLRTRGQSRITDNMILSVVSACVKGSKVKRRLVTTVVSSSTEAPDSAAIETSSDEPAMNVTDSGNNATTTENSSNSTSFASPPPPPPPQQQRMLRELTIEERRKPLDFARSIILSMEDKYDIPLVSRHVNPLAAAYNRLGLRAEGSALINDQLEDRMPPEQSTKATTKGQMSKGSKQKYQQRKGVESQRVLTSERPGFEGVQLNYWDDDDLLSDDDDDSDNEDDDNEGYEQTQLNIHQMKSKDRASYALLVQGAAMDGNYTSAIKELQRMTDAGYYPNTRNLNSWFEVMEGGCRPRTTGNDAEDDNLQKYGGYGRQRRRSWKKKRDGIWLGNLR